MIAYEELEKALAKWKARRTNGAEAVPEQTPQEESEGEPTGPAVVAAEGYQKPDNTGEIDLADAEVTDA
jgi:hypothetical protein